MPFRPNTYYTAAVLGRAWSQLGIRTSGVSIFKAGDNIDFISPMLTAPHGRVAAQAGSARLPARHSTTQSPPLREIYSGGCSPVRGNGRGTLR
jgi:hypothetical protein